MKITILNQQKHLKVRPRLLRSLAELVLEGQRKDTELSVRLVGDKAIAILNEKYLHHHGPTDVIAFPMHEGSFKDLHRELLGDVVISAETAIQQARKYKKSPGEELCLYVVHGILHLLGYDDIAPRSRRRMERKQQQLLKEAQTYYGEDFFDRAATRLSKRS